MRIMTFSLAGRSTSTAGGSVESFASGDAGAVRSARGELTGALTGCVSGCVTVSATGSATVSASGSENGSA